MSGTVLFRCADQSLALPMTAVVEVWRMVAPASHPPRAPRHLIGVVDCRGQLVPLVDLGARLGLCPRRSVEELIDGHVLVLSDRLGRIGYAVDEVRELLETATETVPSAHATLGAFVDGAIRAPDGELVPLLDPSALLTLRARESLIEALRRLAAVEDAERDA
jgi:purine-binding chemotaxis protein CheW